MRPPMSWRVMRVDDFGAGPHRSASDNSAAFEAAVEEAKERGKLGFLVGAAILFSPGTYYFDRTLDITLDVDDKDKDRGHGTWLVGDQTVLHFVPRPSDYCPPAVCFAGLAEIKYDANGNESGDYRIQHCGIAGISIVGPGTTTWGSRRGLLLDNAWGFKSWGLSVRGFDTGIHLRSDTFGVCSNNELHLGEIVDNRVGLWLDSEFDYPRQTGWLNENRVHGGRWSCSSVTAHRHLLLTGAMTSNTKFHDCTFGPGAEVAAQLGDVPDDEGSVTKVSALNSFTACRFQGPVHIQSHQMTRFLGCTIGTSTRLLPPHPALLLRARVLGGSTNFDLHTFLLGTRVLGYISVIDGEVKDLVWGNWTLVTPARTLDCYNFPPNNYI
jgi:hypothetical protein